MKIEYTKSAEKDILSLDRTIARRIYSKIANLEDDPFGQGARKLEGEKGYRIRIGNYRVVYIIDKANKVLTVIKIARRKEAYR